MARTVTFALIDALDEHPPLTSGWPPASRYVMPIGNLPVICHVLCELASGGIERARIVAHHHERKILEERVGNGEVWGVRLSYADARDNDRDRALLIELEQAVSKEAVLVHPGDCLFPGQVSLLREGFRAGDVDLLLLGRLAPALSQAHDHDPLLSDPPPGDPPSRDPQARSGFDTAVVLGAGTGPVIGELAHGRSGGHRLIDSLVAADLRFGVCELGAQWCYGDSIGELLLGNQIVLDALPPMQGHRGFGDRNQIVGRVAIKQSARISNSTIRGPTVIDEDAVVEDSFIGPYTAIGRGALVTGAEIDNAIVLADARIQHPGYRIEASVIGERACISRSFELPKGLHLRLGADSQITLS